MPAPNLKAQTKDSENKINDSKEKTSGDGTGILNLSFEVQEWNQSLFQAYREKYMENEEKLLRALCAEGISQLKTLCEEGSPAEGAAAVTTSPQKEKKEPEKKSFFSLSKDSKSVTSVFDSNKVNPEQYKRWCLEAVESEV